MSTAATLASQRFLSQLRLDVALQWRNGFYLASALILLPTVWLLRLLPEAALAWALPLVLFQNTVVNSFFFAAGLVLLERDEGSLAAQAVAPLRDIEYLASKALSLSALATAEGVLIARLTFPGAIAYGSLILGQLALALSLACVGMLVIVRYRALNEFLMPSMLWLLALCLPLFGLFGVLPGAVLALHPLEPATRALVAAFAPLAPTPAVAGSAAPAPFAWYPLLSICWVGALAWVANRRFRLAALGAVA